MFISSFDCISPFFVTPNSVNNKQILLSNVGNIIIMFELTSSTLPSQQPNSGLSSARHVLHSGLIWVANSGPLGNVQLGNWSARYTLRNDGPLSSHCLAAGPAAVFFIK